MFGGLHGGALVRLARWLSNVGVAAMRPDVGADVLQAAKADGAKTISALSHSIFCRSELSVMVRPETERPGSLARVHCQARLQGYFDL